MKFSSQFAAFIETGKRPTSDREANSLLDESRSVISSIIDRVESGQIAMAPTAQAAAAKPIFSKADREFLAKNEGSLSKLQAHRKGLAKSAAASPAKASSAPTTTSAAPVAPKAAATPAPAPKPSPAPKAAAPLTGFAKVSAAFAKPSPAAAKPTATDSANLTGLARASAFFAKKK